LRASRRLARTPLPDADRHTTGERLFPLLWALLWPLRLYLKFAPFDRGKRLLFRTFVVPVVPKQSRSFLVDVRGGGRVRLQSRDVLGLTVLALGDFEAAEIRELCSYARPGSTAIDVGANVGIVAIPLALAVGDMGMVIACEPVAANAERLRENVQLNDLRHVVVREVALGEVDGETVLHLGTDPAFHSTAEVLAPFRTGESIRVRCRTLDDVWSDQGRPEVSVVKIDVEGAELTVLKGARQLLAEWRPVLLLESHDEHRQEVVAWLGELGYRPVHPRRFAAWNYLFLPDEPAPRSTR